MDIYIYTVIYTRMCIYIYTQSYIDVIALHSVLTQSLGSLWKPSQSRQATGRPFLEEYGEADANRWGQSFQRWGFSVSNDSWIFLGFFLVNKGRNWRSSIRQRSQKWTMAHWPLWGFTRLNPEITKRKCFSPRTHQPAIQKLILYELYHVVSLEYPRYLKIWVHGCTTVFTPPWSALKINQL